jgi:hypothetical protein
LEIPAPVLFDDIHIFVKYVKIYRCANREPAYAPIDWHYAWSAHGQASFNRVAADDSPWNPYRRIGPSDASDIPFCVSNYFALVHGEHTSGFITVPSAVNEPTGAGTVADLR